MFNDLIEFANEIGVRCAELDIAPEVDWRKFNTPQGELFDRFLVYIRDFNQGETRKFHFCHCETIARFIQEGRYDKKYCQIPTEAIDVRNTKNDKNVFPVHYVDFIYNCSRADAYHYIPLQPCIHCLKQIDYKGFNGATEGMRKRIVAEFDVREYIQLYKLNPPYLQRLYDDVAFNRYTRTFPELSKVLRDAAGWRCDECKRDFSQNPSYLHVHHKDGVKTNNDMGNLRVLCRDCHERIHGRRFF